MSHKHAVIAFRSLTDAFCITAATRELKARDETCHISCFTSTAAAPALLNNSSIDEIIVLEDSLEMLRAALPQIRSIENWSSSLAPFDDSVCAGFRLPESASLAERLDAVRQSYGFEHHTPLIPFLTLTDEELAEARLFRDLLPNRPLVVIEMDSTTNRSWSKDRATFILEKLRPLNANIILAGGKTMPPQLSDLQKRWPNVYWSNHSARVQVEFYRNAALFLGCGGALTTFTAFLPAAPLPVRFEAAEISNYPQPTSWAEISQQRTSIGEKLEKALRILLDPVKTASEVNEVKNPLPPRSTKAQITKDNRSIETIVSLARSGIAINQLVTSISPGDAITNCMLTLRDILRYWGFQSHIFCESAHPSLEGEWHWFGEHPKVSASNNLLIYHPNSGRSILNDYFVQVPDRKIIYYHNITPAKYFEHWNTEIAAICDSARMVLRQIAPIVEGAICDSNYNAKDLQDLGYRPPAVIPIPFVPEKRFSAPPDRETMASLNDGKTNILFVGRLAPNKCQHDLIQFFAAYSSQVNPNSRLILAGANRDGDAYTDFLRASVKNLDLKNVVFTGSISESELAAYYRSASVFLCLSEHEGFCVPLAEAMYFGVPVVAFDSSAVTETLGGAGLILPSKDPSVICRAIEQVRREGRFQTQLVSKGSERIEGFSKEEYSRRLADFLCQFHGSETKQSLPLVPANAPINA